ncbi:DNA topoisomerase I [hydrothermal vent metagenome]|uniref:DNA topoisomerase I n=1 Tax=hydrothermal vent metagenome TaxID=652676 RepID=A0A3B1DKP6_9ZZZZ
MSGPIVRTGTTPKFWNNWDRIFGDSDEAASAPKTKKNKKTKAKAGKKKKSKKT